MADGGNVRTAAHDHGLNDPASIGALEQFAARGRGLSAVKAGQSPGKVAFALDISDPAIENSLKNVAALMCSSDPELRQLAQKADLHPDAAYPIEYAAAHGPALQAVRAGEPVYAVMERMGISDPDLAAPLKNVAVLVRSGDLASQQFAQHADLGDPAQHEVLERLAAHGPAMAALKAGEPLAAVLEQTGISDPLLKNDLKNMAALVHSGSAGLRALAQQLRPGLGGPEARHHLARLEGVVVKHLAVQAVLAGEPAAAVSERMGIGQPQHRMQLAGLERRAHVERLNKNVSALATAGDDSVKARANELLQMAQRGSARAGRKLEEVTTRSVAADAVKGGESVPSVAHRMGISSPDLLAELETSHRQGRNQIIGGAQRLPPIIE